MTAVGGHWMLFKLYSDEFSVAYCGDHSPGLLGGL